MFGQKLAAYEHYFDSSKVLAHTDKYTPVKEHIGHACGTYCSDRRGGHTVVDTISVSLFLFPGLYLWNSYIYLNPPRLIRQSVVIGRHHFIVRDYYARSAGSIIDSIKKKYNNTVNYVKKNILSGKKKTTAAATTAATLVSTKKTDEMAPPLLSAGRQQSG